MTLTSALNLGQMGLTAAANTLTVGAHNVANTLTDGFVALSTEAKDQPGGGVKVSISDSARSLEQAAKAPGGSNVDLVHETTSRIGAAAAYRANLKTIQTADDVSGVVVHLLSNPPEAP
jgi:flagellar basal body rod protein FlgG